MAREGSIEYGLQATGAPGRSVCNPGRDLEYPASADAGEDSFSLVPLMKGADQPHRSHAISTACQGQPSFRDGPWKLILGQGKKVQGIDGNVQLFHLERI